MLLLPYLSHIRFYFEFSFWWISSLDFWWCPPWIYYLFLQDHTAVVSFTCCSFHTRLVIWVLVGRFWRNQWSIVYSSDILLCLLFLWWVFVPLLVLGLLRLSDSSLLFVLHCVYFSMHWLVHRILCLTLILSIIFPLYFHKLIVTVLFYFYLLDLIFQFWLKFYFRRFD